MPRPTQAQIARRRGSLLTTRQEQIAFMSGRGMSNARIARDTGISKSTVGQHLMRIYERLGIDNGRALASWCAAERRSQCPLNARQLALVRLACRGLRNKEIASAQDMKLGAVKQAFRRIYRHVGVLNGRGLVAWALAGGLDGERPLHASAKSSKKE